MIRFSFDANQQPWGVLDVNGSTIALGDEAFKPYDLTLGALCGCYSATIWEMAEKLKVDIPAFTMEVAGEKRNMVPTTLQTVRIDISMEETTSRIQAILVDSAAACSMMATIGCVADITITLNGQTIVKLDQTKVK